MSALLRFEQVTLARGGRLLFEGLDLAVAAGEGLLLTGPNGSGKSSLIRLAAGLLRATRGRVERSAVALADDRPALDPELPLARALGFWGALAGDKHRVEPAMEALGLNELAGVPVRLLSAGQLRRASLARVAASASPLWLLDEPFNGLDSASIARLDALLSRHRDSGGAVLAASHSSPGGSWRTLDLGR